MIKIITFSKKWTQYCACFLMMSHLLPHLGWTFDQTNYYLHSSQSLRVTYLGKKIALPKETGVIKQFHFGTKKTIICVEDLHCNYEVQQNIAAIIDYFNQVHQLQLVGEEGAVGRVDTGIFRTFPLKTIRREVSDYFVRIGKLSGAEYGIINAKEDMILTGIEDEPMYTDSLKFVRAVLSNHAQGLVIDLKDTLNSLKDKLYHPTLASYDQLQQHYQAGQLNRLSFVKRLSKLTHHLKLDLNDYPDLINFKDGSGKIKKNYYTEDQFEQAIHALDLKIEDVKFLVEIF